MPIPKPNSGESESDFVGRCMSEIGNEYDQDQAVAICFNTYRTEKAEAMEKNIQALKDSEKYVNDFLSGQN